MGDYEKRIQESKAAHDKEDILYAPGSRVLIVDDNDMNLKVARNLLKICGIKPQEALSGKETIEKMKESTFDIVFLDHMMPEMDGIETLHKLQESHLIPEETVMIVLTANAVVGAKENYLKEGFADYLSKPIEIGNLVEILKQYLPQSAYGSAEAEVDDGILEFEPEDGDYIAAVEREEKEPGYDLERLKELGIDTAKGLGYSAGDEAIYFEMLSDFTGGYAEKLAETDRLFAGENWLDYGTMVHAMKSNGKMIGANSVFEIAKKLEEAAKEENAEVIKENHPQLIKIVSETADNIRKALQ
jgi:CheY-like chemotaxis protein/HPt (histidine-containing phosphotransfer) domain-containing protein